MRRWNLWPRRRGWRTDVQFEDAMWRFEQLEPVEISPRTTWQSTTTAWVGMTLTTAPAGWLLPGVPPEPTPIYDAMLHEGWTR